MKNLSKLLLKYSAATAVLGVSSSVFAGGAGSISMTLQGATAVPTLSGSMLILLSLLLFAVAFRVAKQKNAGKLFMTLMGVTVLSTGIGGVKLISDSFATGNSIPQSSYAFGYSIGETKNVELNSFDNYIVNDHTSPMTIGAITSSGSFSCAANQDGRSSKPCDLGTLAPGQSCGVYCAPIQVGRKSN